MLSLQTNVNALVAQQNLSVNNAFQSKTIQQLTSGYRINSSGDDAAGLAVANKFRNQVAELTQGVANGNDGVAQLQIMDGGMSNISQILDRLKTLAMQSASGSFTGGATGRAQLNSEFQTDLAEINRQAESIGLNQGGTFAQKLGIYLGAGSGSSDQANSVVNVDLSAATVDTRSLGLAGSPAMNSATYDLSTASQTNIAAIVAANSGDSGTATFTFQGPGFASQLPNPPSGSAPSNGVSVSVSLTGITTTDQLVTAINTKIANTAAGGSAADTAFGQAGIQAQIVTDSSGNQKLSFTAPSTAFQVAASNATANALMGNFSTAVGATTGTGAPLGSSVSAATGPTDATGGTVYIHLQGGGLATQDLTVTHVGGAGTWLGDLQTQLTSTGYSATTNTSGALVLSASTGQQFEMQVAGAAADLAAMGLKTGAGYEQTALGSGAAAYSSITAGALYAAAGIGAGDRANFNFNINGKVVNGIQVSLTAATPTIAQVVGYMNTAFKGNATLAAAGITATVDAAGTSIKIVSENGTKFQVSAGDGSGAASATNRNLGFGVVGGNLSATTSSTVSTNTFQSQSVNQSAMFQFHNMYTGSDTQSVTISAPDKNGVTQTAVVNLNYSNASNIDEALEQINQTLQGVFNPALQKIVAYKVNDGSDANNQKIEFQSAGGNFTVAITSDALNSGLGTGTVTSGSPSFVQGTSVNSSLPTGSGATLDIGTQTGAQAAVTAITNAVGALGTAQAAVGKGENVLNYAISLAQSQITNFSSAEAQIRDANVAAQAANLTKAQVLQQASIAAMAQANSAPQAVLTLLRG